MINIFILCTEVIIKHMFVGFIENMVVFIKKSNKFDYPHHAILNIAKCAERADGIAKPDVIPIGKPCILVYDITVLALLSHRRIRHTARCLIITW